MRGNIVKWLLIFCFCVSIAVIPENVQAASKVRFVKKVSKSCKHLGTKAYPMDKDIIFPSGISYGSVEAGDAFATALKKDVEKQGGNRVVIADVFHDITVYSGRYVGRDTAVDASYIEVQIFRCGK